MSRSACDWLVAAVHSQASNLGRSMAAAAVALRRCECLLRANWRSSRSSSSSLHSSDQRQRRRGSASEPQLQSLETSLCPAHPLACWRQQVTHRLARWGPSKTGTGSRPPPVECNRTTQAKITHSVLTGSAVWLVRAPDGLTTAYGQRSRCLCRIGPGMCTIGVGAARRRRLPRSIRAERCASTL